VSYKYGDDIADRVYNYYSGIIFLGVVVGVCTGYYYGDDIYDLDTSC